MSSDDSEKNASPPSVMEIPVDEDGILKLTTEEAKAILEQVSTSNFELDCNLGDLNFDEDLEPPSCESANAGSSDDKRFSYVSLEDTDKFLMDNINKNTAYKTKADVKIFTEWLHEMGEERPFQEVPASEMDSLLARFILSVRKKDKTEYEPDTISSIFNSIERYGTKHLHVT